MTPLPREHKHFRQLPHCDPGDLPLRDPHAQYLCLKEQSCLEDALCEFVLDCVCVQLRVKLGCVYLCSKSSLESP